MRVLLVVAAGLALTGCAAKPLPTMDHSEYQKMAQALHVADVCESRGAIEPVLLGYGYTRLQQHLAGFSYDQAYLVREIEAARSTEVTTADCNRMATVFAQMRDTYDRNVRASQQSSPQYTQCYSGAVGTNCYSY